MAVPFVASGEKFLDGCVNTFPRCAPRLETFDGRQAGGMILFLSRNQVGNRFAVAGDRDRFAALNCAQELCEMGLGFGGLNFAHDLHLTGCFDRSNISMIFKAGSSMGPA